MKTKSFKFLCMLFSILMFGACAKDEEVFTGNIMGKVTDAVTSEVLQGVTVSLSPGGVSKTTGSDGTFEFWEQEPRQYEIQARKKGYVTNNKSVTVITGKDIRGDIQLTPEVAKLELSTNALNFGKSHTSLSFEIINEGNINFNWNISGLDNVDWLEVAPTSGSLAAGKSYAVQVNVLREKLTESKEITLLVNVDKQSVALKVSAEVEEKFSKITLDTHTLNFGEDYTSLTFDIHNEGNKGDADWRITDIDVDWIKVSPTTGTTAMGKSSTVKVDVDREKLPEGDQTTTILVNSEGESQRVSINATGEKRVSMITLSKTTLDFGLDLSSLTFGITNVGNAGDINWEIGGINVDWVKVAPLTGTTSMDKSSAVKVELDREKLPEGKQTTTILVNAYGESFPVTINAEKEIKVAKITLSKTTLDFGLDYSSLTFDITNVGNAGDVSWTITGVDVDWVKVFPVSGTTSMDKSSAVKVEVDREKMAEGRNATTILVEAYGESFPVTIKAEKKPARYIEVMPSSLVLGTSDNATLSVLSHNGTTAYELYGDGDYSWAKFSKTEGVIPEYSSANVNSIEHITISADRTGLAAGDYSFTLIIRSDLGDYNVPVSMTVEENQAAGGDAEIISCNDDLVFTITSCKMSGTTATLSYMAENIGNSAISLRLYGENGGRSYIYDDQGNQYNFGYNAASLTLGNHASYQSVSATIPAGVKIKGSVKITNVSDLAAAFSNITIWSASEQSYLIFKNVAIEGRSHKNEEEPRTTGIVTSCSDDLEFILLDCKRSSSNTVTISYRVMNLTNKDVSLRLYGENGGISYIYDDQGNQYNFGYNAASLTLGNHASYQSVSATIPGNVFTKGSVIIKDVDASATEMANVTIWSPSHQAYLTFQNVKIR